LLDFIRIWAIKAAFPIYNRIARLVFLEGESHEEYVVMHPVDPAVENALQPAFRPAAEAPPKGRIMSVDALRGLVMIIMALDHTRDFFHAGAMVFQPEDLTRTTVPLFFTRWVTHICAPVFMFTAGMGAFFRLRRGRTPGQLARFLWSRGLWLMFLDLTVLRLAMNFSLFSGPVLLNVLWALGLSMVVLGFLVWLPVRVLAGLSILTVALHNLTDPLFTGGVTGAGAWLWHILHQPGMVRASHTTVLVAYTLVPWVAVMAAGFCFGKWMNAAEPLRRRRIAYTGIVLIALFLMIRGINLYGDPVPWSSKIPGMTVLSFLKCTKYPPSLDFLLMTLGPALLSLAWFEQKTADSKTRDRKKTFATTNPLIVFGRVPFFYFMCHIFLIHALTIPFALARYGRADFLFNTLPSAGGPANLYPPGYGYSLGVVYCIWVLVVLLMYPVCLWFARLKERRRDWWLSYL
jgi:uncharacterized membrane protein